ncbi:hypothetical protein CKO23_11235 [Thiocystis violacea]|nr:hypothetical protein [Thiocystis violacea]
MPPSVSAFAPPVWAFGGSRSLAPQGRALAERAALALLRSGAGLVTGCCTGADASALSAACSAGLAKRVSVLSAFGPVADSGWPAGACPASAVAEVRRAAGFGAAVQPWAGGPASIALSARLAARTRAVARACNAGAVVVLAPGSRGALILARAVVRRGLPVVALPVAGASLPELGGRWVPASGVLAGLGGYQLKKYHL